MTRASLPSRTLQSWENVNSPRRWWNTNEGLTHSLDNGKEGLDMKSTRICCGCGSPIPRKPNWSFAHYETRKFCDRECQGIGRPQITDDYAVTDSGCWEWQGAVDRNGYGKAYDPEMPAGRRVDWAHRVSYRRNVGDIPDGLDLDHLCQNTVCINPEHLEPVTRAEHARRTFQRLGKDGIHDRAGSMRRLGLTFTEIAEALGLSARGSAADAVKAAIRKGLVNPDDLPTPNRLDEQDYADIRTLYAIGVPQIEIAAWYRIDSSQVSRICSGQRSGHGTPLPREAA